MKRVQIKTWTEIRETGRLDVSDWYMLPDNSPCGTIGIRASELNEIAGKEIELGNNNLYMFKTNNVRYIPTDLIKEIDPLALKTYNEILEIKELLKQQLPRI